MMKKINVIVLATLLLLLLLPITTVYAEDVKPASTPITELKQGDKVVLESGEEAIYLGISGDGYRFRATLGVPVYIPGTTIKIEPNWSYNHTTTQWESGANLFYAIVKGGKVTIWKDGQKMSWEPTVLVGTKDTKALIKEPTLLSQDPINENYWGNTLMWEFPDCKRYLRIIEGVLSEYYVFETNPGADVQIKSNLYKDPNFIWDKAPYAYDADGNEIIVSPDKLVRASEFARLDITYPVTVDPTTTYTTSSSDGYLYNLESTYSAARTESSADSATDSSTFLAVGQGCVSPYYYVYRSYLYFDTSGLPDGCEIDSATLKLRGRGDSSDTNFDITITSGMPTYPHDPLDVDDFQYNLYAAGGGTFGTASFSTSGYNEVTLSATGEEWINKEGYTKFCLKSSRDINANTPTGYEEVTVDSYEMGSGCWPQLEVTYSAASVPTVTTQAASDMSTSTAKLHCYLDNDGGIPCQIMWEYDTDSGAPYTYNTSWLATNYTTGQSPYKVIGGLNTDDTYYFRVVAKNSEGTTNGSEITFDTLSSLNPPTNFRAITRSSTEISLTWTRGIGASQTLVRYKIGDYPTTTSDGTLAYNDTRGSYTITDLTPGTTYKIKAWGYDAGNFSTSNVTEMATTFSGEAEGTSPFEAPDEPSNFWGPPSYTNLSNLPFYENFNERADDIGMDRGNFWMMIFWMIAIVLGAGFFMMTKEPTWAIIGVSIGVVWGWQAGPIPGIWMLVYVISALIVSYALNRGGAYA